MQEKSTTQLDNILKSTTKHGFDSYMNELGSDNPPSLMDYFNRYIGNRKLSEIIEASLLSKDYAYGIFNGSRTNPSQDRIIALCVALGLSLDDTQRALKIGGVSVLYSKNLRDAAIVACINNNDSVMDINLFLSEKGLEPLSTSKAN